MTVRKLFRSVALFLTVGLVVLALSPGLAPTYADSFTVLIGGSADLHWGPPSESGPIAQSINGAVFIGPPFQNISGVATAKAGPGVVDVFAFQNYYNLFSLSFQSEALATAGTTVHFADPSRPDSYVINTTTRLLASGHLSVFQDSTSSADASIGFSFTNTSFANNPLFSLLIENHNGTGNVITHDDFGVNFDPATGDLIGFVTTPPFAVTINGDNAFSFIAVANTFARASGPLGGTALLKADFLDTFSFAPTGLVFLDLPAGVTVNGGGIVDNHYTNPFAPVPLPGTLPLLGSGLLGLVAFRLRLKK